MSLTNGNGNGEPDRWWPDPRVFPRFFPGPYVCFGGWTGTGAGPPEGTGMIKEGLWSRFVNMGTAGDAPCTPWSSVRVVWTPGHGPGPGRPPFDDEEEEEDDNGGQPVTPTAARATLPEPEPNGRRGRRRSRE